MLKDRVAVVTGGTRGIGLAVARRLLEQGARVALLARSRPEAPLVGDGRVLNLACDVSDWESVRAAFAEVQSAFGPVDILVNNAGVGRYGGFLELVPTDWSQMYGVNVLGVVHCIQAVLPSMLERRHGHIVNLSSIQAAVPSERSSAYSATKAALEALSQSLALEVGPKGVLVSIVSPGGVLTDFAGIPAAQKNPRFLDPEEVAEAVLAVLEAGPKAWVREVSVLPKPS